MTDDRLKMIFGFSLLLIVAVLSFAIALGKVEQATSYGLHDVLIILAGMGGAFVNWAFGKSTSDQKVIEMVQKISERLDRIESKAA